MPRPGEEAQPISPDLAARMIPLCRVRECEKVEGHDDEHGPIPFPLTPGNRPVRKWSRSYLYGRSRANRWPLWVSWLLAGSAETRSRVTTLMELRRQGVDV